MIKVIFSKDFKFAINGIDIVLYKANQEYEVKEDCYEIAKSINIIKKKVTENIVLDEQEKTKVDNVVAKKAEKEKLKAEKEAAKKAEKEAEEKKEENKK